MSKIKLNLQRLNIPEKLARSRQIVAAMTGNADFASPQPTLAQITDAINELAAAFDAADSLSASAGDRDGEMDLRWDKVERARSYVIEFSPDPPTPTSWTHGAVSTKSQFTLGGLTSGTRYWFRVAAVGPLGQ